MTDYFLNGFIKKSLAKSTSNAGPYGKTVPAKDCINGFPISRYAGYGVNAWEVLYSIWVANQTTIGAKFTNAQAKNGAPGGTPLCIGPENIFVIRHGEKNSSSDGNYKLNNNGIYRACQLIEYVNKLATAGTPISYIIVCNPCAYNTENPTMRPQQTMAFTSSMLNIPMFTYGGSQDYDILTDKLFNSGIFDGLNVFICWEHTAIQQLCLNILNAAGIKSRLNNITEGTDGKPEWYGDAYFATYSTPDNLCPGGNYLCNDINNIYYTDNTKLIRPGSTGLPPCIGPNSMYYPYWNTHNFESVYWFKSSSSSEYKFTFKTTKEPILTCYSNCELIVGLYQPLNPQCNSGNKYYDSSNDIENECLPPTNWLSNN
jgi:hypothetical protein